MASASILRSIGVSAMPFASPGRSDLAASFLAASATACSNLEFDTAWSTRRHFTARAPLTPSSVVQKASAKSRRTLRLSVTRVRPPVPGSTASSGSSGSATVELPSSASRM